MQLDTVVAGFTRPRCRRTKLLDDGIDVQEAQAVNLLPPARPRHLHEMDDLREDLGVRCIVDTADEIAVARKVLVARKPQQRTRFAVMDRGRLDHDLGDVLAPAPGQVSPRRGDRHHGHVVLADPGHGVHRALRHRLVVVGPAEQAGVERLRALLVGGLQVDPVRRALGV